MRCAVHPTVLYFVLFEMLMINKCNCKKVICYLANYGLLGIKIANCANFSSDDNLNDNLQVNWS